MTIERLEEIAAWAEKYVLLCKLYENHEIAAYYADLARCARLLIKADKLKREYEHFKRREGLGAFLGIGVNGGADHKSFLQVIEGVHEPSREAVEAAGGGE